MTTLSANQRAFVSAMKADPEAAKWGFEALLERSNFLDFFDALVDAGLFSPSNNPPPVATQAGKYWTIPYWPALDYLEKCARHSTEVDDRELARKILRIIKEISDAITDGEPDNYHTFRKFAEIIGLVPVDTIDDSVINLIPVWLGSKFDTGLVTAELDQGFLTRALSVDDRLVLERACETLGFCTALKSSPDEPGGLTAVADDYWLRELIKHHAANFGRRAGWCAASLLISRTKQVFEANGKGLPTSLIRPAIEDHEQNHEWRKVENALIEGARDVSVNWVDADSSRASAFVMRLLQDESEIARRIALFTISEKWNELSSQFLDSLGKDLFELGLLHELYHLLRRRFAFFPDDKKKLVVDIINSVESDVSGEQGEIASKRLRRRWLSALQGGGYQPAMDAFSQLVDDPTLGPLIDHPDFTAYSETRWGFGPSAFTAAELAAFAHDGSLLSRLDTFKESGSWDGPTVRAVADALAEAVQIDPHVFCQILPDLVKAKYAYQYGVVNGFKKLWDADGPQHGKVDWSKAWEALLQHFQTLLVDDSFWGPPERISTKELTPDSHWIIGLIADFLEAGTKRDEKSYAEELLPRGLELIHILLARTQGSEVPGDDPMSQAINSHRGKAIEALVNHALREARLADKSAKDHSAVWKKLEPTFDAEVAKARNANFEFSTLAGAYIANLEYLNRRWVERNIEKLFPLDCEPNLLCALGGLAYAPATRSIYLLLNQGGRIELSLELTMKGRHTREKLVERIALAYLWEDEGLDSPRVQLFFKNRWIDDLKRIADFFWSVRGETLQENTTERIVDFLRYCLSWQKDGAADTGDLLQHLAHLIVYVRKIDKDEAEWLQVLAPHLGRDFFAFEFADQLRRLMPQNPTAIAAAFERMVDSQVPYSDYKDRMKDLILDLARNGERERALRIADKLRSIRGMTDVYEQLRLK